MKLKAIIVMLALIGFTLGASAADEQGVDGNFAVVCRRESGCLYSWWLRSDEWLSFGC
jgi:hypothetical protein